MCIFINTLSITYSVYIMLLYVCCVYIPKYIKYNLLSVYNATLCMFSELTILKWITSWSVLPWGRLFFSILTIP